MRPTDRRRLGWLSHPRVSHCGEGQPRAIRHDFAGPDGVTNYSARHRAGRIVSAACGVRTDEGLPLLQVQPAPAHHPAAVPAPVEPRRVCRVERREPVGARGRLWGTLLLQPPPGHPVVRAVPRPDGSLGLRRAAPGPTRCSDPDRGPRRVLRAQRPGCLVHGLPAPPVRGARPLAAALSQRPAAAIADASSANPAPRAATTT